MDIVLNMCVAIHALWNTGYYMTVNPVSLSDYLESWLISKGRL